MPKLRSIRSRFLAINLPIVLLAVVAAVAAAEWLNYKNEIARLKDKLTTMSASQSIILATAVAEGDDARIGAIIASSISNPEVRGICVHDADGNEVDAYGDGCDESGELTRITGINFADESGITRVGRLAIAMSKEPIVAAFHSRLPYEIGLAMIALIAVVLAAQIAFGRTVATPMERLLDAIEKNKGGEDRSPVEWASDDEIGRVIAAFNELQKRQTEYERALAEAQASLEDRVVQRTAQLEVARREAEMASQAKSQFLACMSHELRTPLNGILGFSEMLNVGKADLTDKQRDYVEIIAKSGNVLLRLIDQLLDLNKIETGVMVLDVEDVSVMKLVEECFGLLITHAESEKVSINADFETLAPVWVRADQLRLQQVLLNVLGNAIKYNRSGGRIEVTAATVGDKVTISISDTGVGIAERHHGNVFEAFNRLGHEMGTVEGTGLGLTISRQLMEMMGGEIYFESAEDDGTTFYLVLEAGVEVQPTRDFIRISA